MEDPKSAVHRFEPPPFSALTPEEIRTLRECNRLSFYYRALPISTLSMLSMGLAIRNGYVKKSYTMAKILSVGLAGFIIGKVSYIGKCKEMIKHLPNSPLGSKLRQIESSPNPTQLYQEFIKEMSPLATSTESSSQSPPSTFRRDDYDWQTTKGLDDRFRPTLDRESGYKTSSGLLQDDNNPPSLFKPFNQSMKDALPTQESSNKNGTLSYDELRYLNRQGQQGLNAELGDLGKPKPNERSPYSF